MIMVYCYFFFYNCLFHLLYIPMYVGSPSPVTNLRVDEESIGCTTATILWNGVSSHTVCGSLIYFITRTTSSGATTTIMTNSTRFHFNDLNSTTSYTITVTGRNGAGDGESSNVIVITTSQELRDTDLDGEFKPTHMHAHAHACRHMHYTQPSLCKEFSNRDLFSNIS